MTLTVQGVSNKHCLLTFAFSLVDTCWDRDDFLALWYVMFSCAYVTSNVVPLVRCATCLYGLLIFDFSLAVHCYTEYMYFLLFPFNKLLLFDVISTDMI